LESSPKAEGFGIDMIIIMSMIMIILLDFTCKKIDKKILYYFFIQTRIKKQETK